MEEIYENAYIYLITVVEKQSSLFGKKYVGQHNGKINSYITSGKLVKRIIKKYGTGSIDKVIIVKQPMTDEQLNELEKFYINYYDTFNNGLNLTLGGGGSSGCKLSDEHKEKLLKANKGRIVSDEVKAKMSIAKKGKKHSRSFKLNLTNKTLYSFIHKDGTIEENITMYDFYTKYNINRSLICAVCKGKRKSHSGWTLLFKNIKEV